MADFSIYGETDLHAAALAFLERGRDKSSRPIANNTRLELRTVPDGEDGPDVAVRLHSTDVVTYHADGTITLDTGGWHTPTTADRMRRYSPVRVSSERGTLVVYTPDDPTTAPRVQKCRKCDHGKRPCDGPGICYGPSRWGPTYCRGGERGYAGMRNTKPTTDGLGEWVIPPREETRCEHGKLEGHATEPCQHGEWSRHRLETCHHGETTAHTGPEDCRQCGGVGRYDYGSKPIPVQLTGPTTFDADGTLIDGGSRETDSGRDAMADRINAYARAITDPDVLEGIATALLEGDTAGDCFYCQMVTDDGTPAGDAVGDTSHLESHMGEGYFVPTLVMNAYRARGYGSWQAVLSIDVHEWAEGKGPRGRQKQDSTVYRNVRTYLRKRLLGTGADAFTSA